MWGSMPSPIGLEPMVPQWATFGRDKAIYDPLHDIPVLARKPCALRTGAPFKDWDLPSSIRRVQRKLGKVPNGDRPPLGTLLRNAVPGMGWSRSSA